MRRRNPKTRPDIERPRVSRTEKPITIKGKYQMKLDPPFERTENLSVKVGKKWVRYGNLNRELSKKQMDEVRVELEKTPEKVFPNRAMKFQLLADLEALERSRELRKELERGFEVTVRKKKR